jgi:CMP-N,N'-diacetyllegionaminic acid synthase
MNEFRSKKAFKLKKYWAVIPARGGSKSIYKKNIVLLNSVPLINYSIAAAKDSGLFERIICSTDDNEIADTAIDAGIEIDWRPKYLATDQSPVIDTVREFLLRQNEHPSILALIQPTSPFLLPVHISKLIKKMENTKECNSGQTITRVPHNYHSWNQRTFNNNNVEFLYKKERTAAYNKQKKPILFNFGNLVAAYTESLINGMDFFSAPSVGVEINWPYNIDVDNLQDLKLAEILLQSNSIINNK